MTPDEIIAAVVEQGFDQREGTINSLDATLDTLDKLEPFDRLVEPARRVQAQYDARITDLRGATQPQPHSARALRPKP